jgi:hypothetical protein
VSENAPRSGSWDELEEQMTIVPQSSHTPSSWQLEVQLAGHCCYCRAARPTAAVYCHTVLLCATMWQMLWCFVPHQNDIFMSVSVC